MQCDACCLSGITAVPITSAVPLQNAVGLVIDALVFILVLCDVVRMAGCSR